MNTSKRSIGRTIGERLRAFADKLERCATIKATRVERVLTRRGSAYVRRPIVLRLGK